MNEYDDPIHILDPISINLDEEDTLDDPIDLSDEYETIDLDNDLPHMLSTQLKITPSNEHCDSQEDPCLELAIIPTILDIVPLVSCLPTLNNINQDGEG